MFENVRVKWSTYPYYTSIDVILSISIDVTRLESIDVILSISIDGEAQIFSHVLGVKLEVPCLMLALLDNQASSNIKYKFKNINPTSSENK